MIKTEKTILKLHTTWNLDPIKIAAILINLLLNYYKMVYNQGLSIQLSPTLYNEKE